MKFLTDDPLSPSEADLAFPVFNLEDITQAVSRLSHKAIRKALAAGFKSYAQGAAGGVQVPPVQHIGLVSKGSSGAFACLKTARLPGSAPWVTKVAGMSGHGAMLLFDPTTAALVGVLVDNGYLTELRTALVGALAAEAIIGAACDDISWIGVVGTGVQARFQLAMLRDVTPCRRVVIFAHRSVQKAELLAQDLERLGFVDTEVTTDPLELRRCGIIVTTTASTAPVLPAAAIYPGTHVTAMGADHDGKMELEVEALTRPETVLFVDSREQNMEFGEVSRAVKSGAVKASDLIELGDIFGSTQANIGRERKWSANPSGEDQMQRPTTIFDSTGVGVADAVIAQLVFAELMMRSRL